MIQLKTLRDIVDREYERVLNGFTPTLISESALKAAAIEWILTWRSAIARMPKTEMFACDRKVGAELCAAFMHFFNLSEDDLK